VAELGVFRPIHYHLELDDDVRDLDAMLVAIGNIPSYGGGIRITPDAAPDDGMFDILIVHPVSRVTLLRIFPMARKGRHVGHPAVEIVRARTVKVDASDVTAYVDGERLGPLPRSFEVVPDALTTLVPVSGLTSP
jgi:diacylglycerol kinase (ATP)